MPQDILECERHGVGTRLTCAECDRPICPRCMVRSEVGLRCEECARPAAVPVTTPASRPRRRLLLAGLAAAAGLVVLGAALVVGGIVDAPVGSSEPGPPVGSWEPAPALQRVRGSTTALVVGEGTVVVVGGGLGSVPLAATEALAPDAESWAALADLNEPRRGHRGVVLDDGRVLVAGGFDGTQLLASAEIYDPVERRWETTTEMGVPRLGHTMTVLSDGRVLVTGGTGASGVPSAGAQSVRPTTSAEIYDPATGTWTPVDDMNSSRFEHTATLLADGRVLVAGGLGDRQGTVGAVSEAELFDPNTGTFSRTGAMAQGRSDHVAVVLPSGSVLVAGGDTGQVATASAELFDPGTGRWTVGSELRQARRGHSATLLPDGTVLVAGGEFFTAGTRTSLASAERYDPQAEDWRHAGEMSCPRSEHGAALLPDGSVLVVAGDATFPGEPPIAQSCADRYLPGPTLEPGQDG